MTIEGYVSMLRERHRALDDEISTENARPAPDGLRLQALKRQKLRLKELIEQQNTK